MRATRWKIRSVTFLPYMRWQSKKIPLVHGCMERPNLCRGSLDRESCNLRIRCKEKSEETHVSALASIAAAQNTSESRTSRLGLTHWLSSCPHSCHIHDITSSSTLYRDWSISWTQDACSWCATCATVPIQVCHLEENWIVNVPLGDGQSFSEQSRLEIDEGFRTFWAILQDEGQTDLDTESRAADHPQGFGELHQKTRFNVLCDRSESDP